MTETSLKPPPEKGRRDISPRLRNKNLAIAIGIAALIALFYLVTIIKLQGLSQNIQAS